MASDVAVLFVVACALGLPACDTTSTVGFNDPTASDSGPDALASDGGGEGGRLFGALRCGTETPLALCSGGERACIVKEIFRAAHGVRSLAVDDAFVYFVTVSGSLGRRPHAGNETTELASTSQLARFTIDETHLYWTEYHAVVKRIAKGGGAVETVMTPFGHPTEIATDADFVYCVLPESGEVAMTRKTGGPISRITAQADPRAIAVDATHVYWVNGGAGPGAGQLVRAPRSDLTGAQIVVSGLDAPLLLALDGEEAFVVLDSGDVVRMPKSGGAVSLVGRGVEQPHGIGAFGGRVYVGGANGLRVLSAVGAAESGVLEARPVSALTLGCEGVHGLLWYEGTVIRYGR